MVYSFFEGHKTPYPEGFDKIFWTSTLQNIWRERYSFGMEGETRYDFKRDSEQILLNFSENEIKGGSFVGAISKNGQRINIYPKIFWSKSNEGLANKEEFTKYVFSHLIWWLGYTRENLRLVKIETESEAVKGDLLEILIYFFAFYTDKLLSEFIFQDYESIKNQAPVVRGRILISDWVNNISRQNWQEIPCEYSEFQFDNQLNRIIKFVTRLLLSISTNNKSKKILNDILRHLENVSDVEVTVQDCDKVKLNPLFEEYKIVLDSCKMFLECLIIDIKDKSQSTFSFLVKMDWLYQQFLFGFINKNKNFFSLEKVEASKDYIGRLKGTTKEYFNIELDYLFRFKNGRKLIGDAKYKRLFNVNESEKGLSKYNIDRADLYQMIAYSFRKGINDIILLYPKYDDPMESKIIGEKFEILNSKGDSEIELTVCNVSISLGETQNVSFNAADKFVLLEKKIIQQLQELFGI